MRLSESIEKTGFFWLPDQAERRLWGILRISESAEITLEISYESEIRGRLPDERRLEFPSEVSQDRSLPRVDRILGEVGNEYVTLDECVYVEYNPLMDGLGGVSRTVIEADRIFFGIHYEDGKEVSFSKIRLSVEGLDEWLGVSGVELERHSGERGRTISFSPPENIVVSLSEGIKMTFVFEGQCALRFNEATIAQKAFLVLTSDNLNEFEYWEKLIKKIHNLFRFATDQIVSINSITGYSREILREIDGREFQKDIRMYYRRLPHSEIKPEIMIMRMMFRFRDVSDDVDDIIRTWIQNYDVLEPVFNLYFASRSGLRMFQEHIFITLVQGLESLHRRTSVVKDSKDERVEDVINEALQCLSEEKRKILKDIVKHRGEINLRKRLKLLMKPFNDLFGAKTRRNSFIHKVVETRNYLTHYDNEGNADPVYGEDLFELSEHLEALFQLEILRLVGMDSERIRRIVSGNNSLKRKLEV